MSDITILVNHPPIALKRPRFNTLTGKAYDSQKRLRQIDQTIIASQWNRKPLDCPVSIQLEYYLQMPKSWSKKKREKHFAEPCITRPDIDNYIKWQLDTMNGIVYVDDSYVFALEAHKLYSYDPRTEITIKF